MLPSFPQTEACELAALVTEPPPRPRAARSDFVFFREHKRNGEVKKGGGRDPLRGYHADSGAELQTVGEQRPRLFSRVPERLTCSTAPMFRCVSALTVGGIPGYLFCISQAAAVDVYS